MSHSASHHSFDMKKDMGGLWRKMPITFGTFVISTLALAGLPPLAGFFSKDEIIDNGAPTATASSRSSDCSAPSSPRPT